MSLTEKVSQLEERLNDPRLGAFLLIAGIELDEVDEMLTWLHGVSTARVDFETVRMRTVSRFKSTEEEIRALLDRLEVSFDDDTLDD